MFASRVSGVPAGQARSRVASPGTALRDETGATLVEYGLLIALLALVAVGAVQVLGVRVGEAFCPVITFFGGTCP